MVSLKAPPIDNVLFLQGLFSPALQVEVCSWLVFETGFRNSGHI